MVFREKWINTIYFEVCCKISLFFKYLAKYPYFELEIVDVEFYVCFYMYF